MLWHLKHHHTWPPYPFFPMVGSEIRCLLSIGMGIKHSQDLYLRLACFFPVFAAKPACKPSSVGTNVQEFVAWLSLHNLSPSTITTYVTRVGHFHKVHGWSDPAEDFIISKLLEGAHRDTPNMTVEYQFHCLFCSTSLNHYHLCTAHHILKVPCSKQQCSVLSLVSCALGSLQQILSRLYWSPSYW